MAIFGLGGAIAAIAVAIWYGIFALTKTPFGRSAETVGKIWIVIAISIDVGIAIGASHWWLQ